MYQFYLINFNYWNKIFVKKYILINHLNKKHIIEIFIYFHICPLRKNLKIKTFHG